VPLRFTASLVLLVFALAASAASAAPRSASGISPSLVHRGQRTTITIPTFSTLPCIAILSYADGRSQALPLKHPRNHRVTFVARIPIDAAIGAGKWVVSCTGIIRSGTFIVAAVKSTAGADVPRVVVDKQGYSQRPDQMGGGSQISYGLVLRNTSTTEDAKSVYVIVNMVAAGGELIGSKSRTVQLVPAGGSFAFGDSLALRTQVATAQLEITIRVVAHEPKQVHTSPEFANVRIEPNQYDPGWVGEVDGEVVNVNTVKTLSSATLSLVVLDAAGNPIGGGSGYTSATLPSGTRFVFVANTGFSAIPLDRAASVLISSEPVYSAPL
jgi:hypothetical protein